MGTFREPNLLSITLTSVYRIAFGVGEAVQSPSGQGFFVSGYAVALASCRRTEQRELTG